MWGAEVREGMSPWCSTRLKYSAGGSESDDSGSPFGGPGIFIGFLFSLRHVGGGSMMSHDRGSMYSGGVPAGVMVRVSPPSSVVGIVAMSQAGSGSSRGGDH